jgi:hypothetical protein
MVASAKFKLAIGMTFFDERSFWSEAFFSRTGLSSSINLSKFKPSSCVFDGWLGEVTISSGELVSTPSSSSTIGVGISLSVGKS